MVITKREEREYLTAGAIRCPRCKGEDIIGGFIETDSGKAYQIMSCPDCETQWTDVYHLVRIRETEADEINFKKNKPAGLLFSLEDSSSGDKLPIILFYENGAIWFRPEGYGESLAADGKGTPMGIEYHEGQLRVLLWPDINKEEPLIVDMERAKEEERKEEST
jgi:hypothetical protein